MKVRVADDLPIVPLGSSEIQGKILVSLEDGVGCAMYEFYAQAGDEVTLIAFHRNHNHIYYCVEGMSKYFHATNDYRSYDKLYQ